MLWTLGTLQWWLRNLSSCIACKISLHRHPRNTNFKTFTTDSLLFAHTPSHAFHESWQLNFLAHLPLPLLQTRLWLWRYCGTPEGPWPTFLPGYLGQVEGASSGGGCESWLASTGRSAQHAGPLANCASSTHSAHQSLTEYPAKKKHTIHAVDEIWQNILKKNNHTCSWKDLAE